VEPRFRPLLQMHAIPDPIEVVLQIGLEVLEGDLVDSRGTLVGRNPPVRCPHLLLWDVERLCLRSWHVLLASSRNLAPVERTVPMSQPLRSAPTPVSRSLTVTTGWSARV
jgi:hypothetical protein